MYGDVENGLDEATLLFAFGKSNNNVYLHCSTEHPFFNDIMELQSDVLAGKWFTITSLSELKHQLEKMYDTVYDLLKHVNDYDQQILYAERLDTLQSILLMIKD